MAGKFWTTEEVRYLKEHYPTRKASDIADDLGRTVNSVHKAAGVYGVRAVKRKIIGRKYKDMELIKLMIGKGCTPKQIADVVGCTPGSICYRVKVGEKYSPDDYSSLIANREASRQSSRKADQSRNKFRNLTGR